jgi:hypothetical protein
LIEKFEESGSAAIVEEYGIYHPNMLKGVYICMFEDFV